MRIPSAAGRGRGERGISGRVHFVSIYSSPLGMIRILFASSPHPAAFSCVQCFSRRSFSPMYLEVFKIAPPVLFFAFTNYLVVIINY